MVERQQKRVDDRNILTEGFEAQSPHILAVRINRFVRENIKPSNFVDIKYSSFLKADNNETSYSAILIFKGTREEESEEDD
ncbi:MAG TPA: hypothetical protein VJ729_11880 [Nitrososphaeraceae archaeon]|jgi:hypothetical protein|nr:hypothetical protein [Nitrososphaeraceae archaeon]